MMRESTPLEEQTMSTTIRVSDPITREEVAVTRGNTTLYFVMYQGDNEYAVMDEYGDGTGHTWKGDIEGADDFIALHDIFDEVEAAGMNEPPLYHADDPRSHG